MNPQAATTTFHSGWDIITLTLNLFTVFTFLYVFHLIRPGKFGKLANLTIGTRSLQGGTEQAGKASTPRFDTQ